MAGLLVDIAKPTPPRRAVPAVPVHVPPNAPLTFLDRCDCPAVVGDKNGRAHKGSCGAQALVRVTLLTGGQVLFCGHHYGKFGPKITKVAVVHNERERVAPAPVAGVRRTPLVS